MQYFTKGTQIIIRDLKAPVAMRDTRATVKTVETFRVQFDTKDSIRFTATGSRRTFSTHADNYIATNPHKGLVARPQTRNRKMSHILTATDANGQTFYYTGRAGAAWVSPDRAEALPCGTREGAEQRAVRFNGLTVLHRLTFAVEG
jgi:hypothetical protein